MKSAELTKKCPNCRVLARIKRAGGEVQSSTVECDDCGAVTIVPFKPKGYKPVYCTVCYRKASASKCDVLVASLSKCVVDFIHLITSNNF